MNTPTIPPWRIIYDRIAPALALLCLVIALIAAAGTYVNERANDRQDRERLAENERLLECFDDFADTLAGGLPLVRDASAARNASLSKALRKLENVLVKIIDQRADAEDFAGLVQALAEYRIADAQLLQVQAENPYPEPPSEFCKPS